MPFTEDRRKKIKYHLLLYNKYVRDLSKTIINGYLKMKFEQLMRLVGL
jgi:hypothetical protein